MKFPIQWAESFHKNGFLVVPEVLNKEQCSILKQDLDKILKIKKKGTIKKRLFETSKANF